MIAAAAVALVGGQTDVASAAPRGVLQLGHESGVEAAGWSADGRRLLTADSTGKEIILWDAASGAIIDRLTLPVPKDGPMRLIPFDIHQIVVDPDGAGAILTAFATVRDPTVNIGLYRESAGTMATLTFHVDLIGRTVTLTGRGPSPPDDRRAKVDATLKLPPSPDGKRQLAPCAAETCGQGNHQIAIVSRNGKEDPIPLTGWAGRPLYGYVDMTLSGDGLTIVHLEYDGDPFGGNLLLRMTNLATGRESALSHVAARADLSPYKVASYDHFVWLAGGRYALNGETATAMFDADDEAHGARALGAAPAACLMTPVGNGDLFLAAAPKGCPDPAAPTTDTIHVYDAGGWGRRASAAGWRVQALPQLAGRRITAIAASPAEDLAAVAVASPTDGPAILFLNIHPDGQISIVREVGLAPLAATGEPITRLTFSTDGAVLIVPTRSGALAVNLAQGPARALPSPGPQPNLLASNGRFSLVGEYSYAGFKLVDLATLRETPLADAHDRINSLGFLKVGPLFWTEGPGQQIRYWDARSGKVILTVELLADGKFIAFDPEGRYDTNLPPDNDGLRWVMPDSPWMALPAQMFMRDFWIPGLVGKVLACRVADDCATRLRTVPDITRLDRVLPRVTDIKIQAGPAADRARVKVTVVEGADAAAANGKTHSGVYDLRLFRDGRLVAQWPPPSPAAGGATAEDAARTWSADAVVRPVGDGKRFSHVFDVPLPTAAVARDVDLSAYAFNVDRVKGDTVSDSVKIRPSPNRPTPRAFVVAIGVNAMPAIPDADLRFAAADAGALSTALKNLAPFDDVATLSLTAERGRPPGARKADIRAALLTLAGDPRADRARLSSLGGDAARFVRVTPDDAVVITFAGHGWTSPQGDFYLVPADADPPDPDDRKSLASLISSLELADWLRGVDAGEVAMVIDACHSAASVDAGGFKAGPLGDPGLGQLAYDKGIRILAAAQADTVAMEDRALGHGLLTYALVHDGLKRGAKVTLDAWLRAAADRLPILSAEIAARRPPIADRGLAPARPRASAAPQIQHPALFDFTGRPSQAVLRPRPAD